MPRNFVTVHELAKILKVSHCTVHKQVEAGVWAYEEGVRRVGGRITFHWPSFEGKVINHCGSERRRSPKPMFRRV
jgi:hypothetical protein